MRKRTDSIFLLGNLLRIDVDFKPIVILDTGKLLLQLRHLFDCEIRASDHGKQLKSGKWSIADLGLHMGDVPDL